MNTTQARIQKQQVSFGTWLGLFIALVGFPAFTFLLRWVVSRPVNFSLILVVVFAFEWVAALAILAIIVFVERQPLASIRLQWPAWKQVGWGLVFWLLGLFSFAVSSLIIQFLKLGTVSTGLALFASVPLSLRIAIPLTAGFCEEVVFRGYVIERIGTLTGNIWYGAILSLIAFTLGHVAGFGLAGAIQIGVWAIIVTLLYVWQRNLVSCMLMHVLNDSYAYILLPLLFRF